MINIYGNLGVCEFKHDFDEVFRQGLEIGKFKIEEKEAWENAWNYFNEAKTEDEMLVLISASLDKRTRIGKWADNLRDQYFIGLRPVSKYKSLVKREAELNNEKCIIGCTLPNGRKRA